MAASAAALSRMPSRRLACSKLLGANYRRCCHPCRSTNIALSPLVVAAWYSESSRMQTSCFVRITTNLLCELGCCPELLFSDDLFQGRWVLLQGMFVELVDIADAAPILFVGEASLD